MMISLGDICRNYLNMQAQYGSRYANAGPGQPFEGEYPDLVSENHGDGRRLIVAGLDRGNYHAITIKSEDAMEFAARVLEHQLRAGQITRDYYDDRIGAVRSTEPSDVIERPNY